MKTIRTLLAALLCVVWWFCGTDQASAHHVLGRPSYALNEDSNTPSAMQVETQVGDYLVSFMVFPAFPRPGKAGRVNLYIRKSDGGGAYNGKVEFSVRSNGWVSWLGLHSHDNKLGSQVLDDNVYRQGFVFSERGSYVITARFADGVTPYTIDFPLQVGAPPLIGPLGIAAGMGIIVLLGIALVQRRRARSGQTRKAHLPAGGDKL